MPPPISEAISFGFSTTESGPAFVRRLPTFFWPEAVADGVGAPTAVSATGGNAVDPPNQCATVPMIGARNHHASASAPRRTTAQPSFSAPLRQPSMVFHLIHRAAGLERALHQVELRDRENLLESLEVARPGVAPGATERHVRPKRPRLGGEAERGERLLDAVLQQLESGIRRYTRPQDLRPVIVWKNAEAGNLNSQRSRLVSLRAGRLLQS